MKLRKWKMWASYLPGAKLPDVCTSKWAADYHRLAQQQPMRRTIRVEVRDLPKRKARRG